MRANPWSRYVFRRDLLRKLRARAGQVARRVGKSDLKDTRRVLTSCPPEVVFDVGAHVGYVSAFYRKAFPEAEIHCFEPTPETREALQRHLGGDARVHVHGTALSDREGEADFHVDNRTFAGGANSLLPHTPAFHEAHPRARYERIRVPCTTLDAEAGRLGIDRIDVLKLDVEGAELKVLAGGEALLRGSRIGLIDMEVRVLPDFEGQPLLEDAIRWLRARDHVLYNLYPFAEDAKGQALFGNALFLGRALRERLGM